MVRYKGIPSKSLKLLLMLGVPSLLSRELRVSVARREGDDGSALLLSRALTGRSGMAGELADESEVCEW